MTLTYRLQHIRQAHLAIAHRAVQTGSVYPTLFARSVSSTSTARARQLTIVLPIWTNPGPQLPLLCNWSSIPAPKDYPFQHGLTGNSWSLLSVLKALMACNTRCTPLKDSLCSFQISQVTKMTPALKDLLQLQILFERKEIQHASRLQNLYENMPSKQLLLGVMFYVLPQINPTNAFSEVIKGGTLSETD